VLIGGGSNARCKPAGAGLSGGTLIEAVGGADGVQDFLSLCERSELQTTRRRRSPADGSELRRGIS